ncbi:MAG: hypothetical protein Dbin4_03042, partial [Alphaproteobacteria bacterium]|nr:hypothetical protein [Alphaproteobacteria bacterium]
RGIAGHILVMRRGRIVESAPADELFANPAHPYTRALLAAAPEPDLDARLDFRRLEADRLSEQDLLDAPGQMIQLTPGHTVRMGG